MDRRRFLLTSLAGALAVPLSVEAQQADKIARIGVIPSGSPSTSAASVDAFRQRLRELGYVEGRNIAIEVRFAVAQPGRFRGQAAELVGLGVDVIVASGTLATRAAKDETSTIPIVMVTVGDAVGAGRSDDLNPALAAMGQGRPKALLVFAASPVQQTRIVEFAAKNRFPALYGCSEAVEAGGLMSFGPRLLDLWRGAGNYVDKILKGARPGDLPVEQPTKFELVINLKTAKALGLTIPPRGPGSPALGCLFE